MFVKFILYFCKVKRVLGVIRRIFRVWNLVGVGEKFKCKFKGSYFCFSEYIYIECIECFFYVKFKNMRICDLYFEVFSLKYDVL